MYKTIKYSLVTLVILVLLLSGCSRSDSGLYRLSAAETAENEGLVSPVINDTCSDVSDNNGSSGQTLAGDPGSGEQNIDPGTQAVTVSSAEYMTPPQDSSEQMLTADGSVQSVPPDKIFVHVCGAVNDPGVYELENGDRIFNAISLAGGFTPDADESYINLAMAVADGMKIDVPTMDETASAKENGQLQAVTFAAEGSQQGNPDPGQNISQGDIPVSAGTSSAASDPTSGSARNSGLVDINTADVSALMTINGIGKTRAEAIIAYRNEHGAFRSKEDIKNVSGIGNATYEKLKDQITVGSN